MLKSLIIVTAMSGAYLRGASVTQSVFSAGHKMVAQQRIGVVISQINLAAASGDVVEFRSVDQFRRWVRSYVRVENGSDPSVDPWGTVLGVQMAEAKIIVTSAGPDKHYGTVDDIKMSTSMY